MVKKSKTKNNKKSTPRSAPKSSGSIVIDKAKGLVFDSEEALYKHFKKDISIVEDFINKYKLDNDIKESEFEKFDDHLDETLNHPDEIWLNNSLLKGSPVSIYIRYYENEGILPEEIDVYFYMAVALNNENMPAFVFYHSPSMNLEQVENYRQGELLYSRALTEVPLGSIEGDALFESDDLAVGLYSAMMLLRADSDIQEEDFSKYADFRERTIEESDEIWRHTDSQGNVLVNFVAEYSDPDFGTFHYVAVTVEDSGTDSHALLFSFPSNDESLVGRYRYGENLQADEVVQESSH
ncbi:MAG: peptidase [Bdellovibrionaceae bacterium]|nr:peptidase [Pseudobdellovibrionaceae bacterium]